MFHPFIVYVKLQPIGLIEMEETELPLFRIRRFVHGFYLQVQGTKPYKSAPKALHFIW